MNVPDAILAALATGPKTDDQLRVSIEEACGRIKARSIASYVQDFRKEKIIAEDLLHSKDGFTVSYRLVIK